MKSILSFPHLQTVDIAFISTLMFFFYTGDFSTDVVIAHHTAGPVMMFLSMSLHFPDGPEIQSTIHLKTKHFMGCFLALSESSVSASLILMLSVSLLSEEDSLNIIFRMRCDLLLFCVSSGTTCLVNVVFLYFYTAVTAVLLAWTTGVLRVLYGKAVLSLSFTVISHH